MGLTHFANEDHTFNGAWLARSKLDAQNAAKVHATIYLGAADEVFTLDNMPVILDAPNAGEESGDWIELVAVFPDVPLTAGLRKLTDKTLRLDASSAEALAVVKDARIRHVLRPAVARQGHTDSLPRDQATTASSDARSTPQHQPDNDPVRVADFGRHCSFMMGQASEQPHQPLHLSSCRGCSRGDRRRTVRPLWP